MVLILLQYYQYGIIILKVREYLSHICDHVIYNLYLEIFIYSYETTYVQYKLITISVPFSTKDYDCNSLINLFFFRKLVFPFPSVALTRYSIKTPASYVLSRNWMVLGFHRNSQRNLDNLRHVKLRILIFLHISPTYLK